VLDGVFQDEHGDFPAGAYIRNPPTSSHTPASAPGCTIFVKLWQFDPDDRTHVRLDTAGMTYGPASERAGVGLMPLFQDAVESVRLETWMPEAEIVLPAPGGLELLALDGGFTEGGEGFEPQSWLRLPAAATLRAITGANGCRVWVKTGHLSRRQTAPRSN